MSTNMTLPSPLPAQSQQLQAVETKPKSGVDNAALLTGGVFPATSVTHAYLCSTTDVRDVLTNLTDRVSAIHRGDMSQVEEMLIGQAVALQSMFLDLAVRAKKHSSLEAVQTLTQLALRAQSGSRATLQSLAEVKNPRQVAFVRQTNVAQNQQINNAPPSHAKKIENSPNELIQGEHHASAKMDTRAEATPVRVDPDVGTLEAVHRAANR